MFQIPRILCFGLCFAWSIPEMTNAQQVVTVQCKNDGVPENGVCVCQPNFTGENCGIRLENPEEQKKEAIMKCFEEEVTPESSGSGSGSGLGSGEASGEEEEEEDIWNKIECKNEEKRAVDGKCEFVKKFKGRIGLGGQSEVPDAESEEYAKLMKEAQCLLDTVFQDLRFREIEIESISDEDSGVIVYYIIRTSDDVTMTKLFEELASAMAVANGVLNGAVVEDVNECSRGENKCNVLAECENLEGTYTCSCPFNYTDSAAEGDRPGSNCRHVCDDGEGGEQCLNGGECLITVQGEGVCTCTNNYAGERCELEWHIFLNTTIGLGAALGVVLILFVVVSIMLCARNRMNKSGGSKSELVPLGSSSNGEYAQTTESKGVSNPYASKEEGTSVAVKMDDDPEVSVVEDDRL